MKSRRSRIRRNERCIVWGLFSVLVNLSRTLPHGCSGQYTTETTHRDRCPFRWFWWCRILFWQSVMGVDVAIEEINKTGGSWGDLLRLLSRMTATP